MNGKHNRPEMERIWRETMEEILNSDKQYQQQSNNLKYASKFFHTKTLFGKNEQPRVIIAKKEQQTVLEL